MKNIKQFLIDNWVLILSFIYILSPVDFIPGDIVTGIGLIDDLSVLIMTTIYVIIRALVKQNKGKERVLEGEIIK